jgi:hypothetical protein
MCAKFFNSLKTWELKTFYASCHKDTKLILNKRILLRLFLLKNVNEKLFTKVPRETSEGYTPYTPLYPHPSPYPHFKAFLTADSLPNFLKNFFAIFQIRLCLKKILEKIFVNFKNRLS